MILDRDQKQKALKLSVAHRWFPQLEVDVHPESALAEVAQLVTDLDVLSSIPDEFRGFRSVVFDCKTKTKESPVNRALWLAGILKRMKADQGFCILKKNAIDRDHVMMASRLGVILLAEDEVDLYAKATCPAYQSDTGNVGDMDAWDLFFAIPERFPKLGPALRFIRSGFWMIDSSAEAARKTLASLRSLSAEFDPAKIEHVSLFLDYCALFSRAIAVVIVEIFKSYLQPASQADLSEALLVMLYGGRETYQHRNDLFRLVAAKNPEAPVPDLALPEWDRFLQLARQLLDAPLDLQTVPLILREAAFSTLRNDSKRDLAKSLCAESPQGARFAVLIPTYLCRAAKLPLEFSKHADDILLPLLSAK